jgi:hypothetical protein
MIKNYIASVLFLFATVCAIAQVEHVPVSNAVYTFLEHAQVAGWLEHFSTAQLPLARKDIVSALENISKQTSKMSAGELSTFNDFAREFGLAPAGTAVIFYSSSDTNQVLGSRLLSDDEKYIYHYQNSTEGTNLSVRPLGSLDCIVQKQGDSTRKVLVGNLGVRLYGTLSNNFGYYLQATNGTVISGERALALEDPHLHQNVKFTTYDSDFDFTESHVAFEYKWFRADIGRETRQIGSGINQKFIISNGSPACDAINIGAKWSGFEYKFTHASLVSFSDSTAQFGVGSAIPNKYLAMHRFALRPSWGEIGFSEMVIYSKRSIDLAYLNPLSFFKSLEHALHDRDNSLMGLDFTIRPIQGLEFRCTYLLDDIKFSEIGKNYWSNKSALNLAVLARIDRSLDLGVEYARVEPYTFSHFSEHNAVTNDQQLLSGTLQPNSDETSLLARWWYGSRYPLELNVSYRRHGENVTDANGKIIRNVGGDVLYSVGPEDSMKAYFLDGIRRNSLSVGLQTGFELCRGFNIQATYKLLSVDEDIRHYARIVFRFDEF